MNGKKILTACFSCSGVTMSAAKKLAEAVGADLYEIRPATPYTKADLDWTNKKSRSSVEMADPAFRPPLADHDAKIGDRDVILLGFPIWWYTAPSIINTFLESYDFSGKTIVPFATSGGSELGKTESALRALCPKANWQPGRMMNGSPSREELVKWLAGLRL